MLVKRALLLAALGLAVWTPGTAQAGVFIGIGVPYYRPYYRPRVVVVAPPIVVAPAPVVVAPVVPPPVVVVPPPQPVVVQPAPQPGYVRPAPEPVPPGTPTPLPAQPIPVQQ